MLVLWCQFCRVGNTRAVRCHYLFIYRTCALNRDALIRQAMGMVVGNRVSWRDGLTKHSDSPQHHLQLFRWGIHAPSEALVLAVVLAIIFRCGCQSLPHSHTPAEGARSFSRRRVVALIAFAFQVYFML